MIFNQNPIKIKHIMLVVAVILSWEFTFPQHAAADAIQQDIEPTIKTQTTSFNASVDNIETARLPVNADKPQPIAKKTIRVTVTAYSSTVDQCGGDPFTTASGTQVRDGIIAANFLPIGTKVRFPEKFGNKIFIVEDRMSARYWQRADIWMPTRQQAKEWGVQHVKMEII